MEVQRANLSTERGLHTVARRERERERERDGNPNPNPKSNSKLPSEVVRSPPSALAVFPSYTRNLLVGDLTFKRAQEIAHSFEICLTSVLGKQVALSFLCVATPVCSYSMLWYVFPSRI
jgi:hypothetical protein